MGSPSFRSLELDGFELPKPGFPRPRCPGRAHDRACVAVMMDGSFDLRLTVKFYRCIPSLDFHRPAGETHANPLGGARNKWSSVQPDPHSALICCSRSRRMLGRAAPCHHARLGRPGSDQELERPEGCSVLAAEGD